MRLNNPGFNAVHVPTVVAPNLNAPVVALAARIR